MRISWQLRTLRRPHQFGEIHETGKSRWYTVMTNISFFVFCVLFFDNVMFPHSENNGLWSPDIPQHFITQHFLDFKSSLGPVSK